RDADALLRVAPRLTQPYRASMTSVAGRLRLQGSAFLERSERVWTLQAARLEDLSPLAVLARGFAVCYDESGERVLRSAAGVVSGDHVRVRLAEGALGCMVERVDPEA
ncbi:MAG: hypothetical protein LLG08_11055, partial [Actinomycetia bacterium]|nr:hypothetical protein [Actinomycetes bacterium]